ncbi:hypothetical protein KFE80_03940 [bacterium SCSIO 12696]|nr:hypothetical protein KFE80_03940 [bacterium SCSIO 12696]
MVFNLSRETMLYGKRFLQLLILSLTVVFFPTTALADEPTLAIISVAGKRGVPPIFKDIIKGVKNDFDGKVREYSLKGGYSQERLLNDLRSDGVDAVVVLGSSGRQAATAVSDHYPVVMGAVASVPLDGVGGVVLQPSSSVVLRYLSQLAPDVKALHLVYDPKKHQMALAQTEESASSRQVVVTAHPSNHSKETQQAIEQSLATADQSRRAIWVLFGTKFDNAIKENLIKDSWGQPVIPFHYTISSKDIELFPFVLLPDWQGMGQQLSDMVSQRLDGKAVEVLPLNRVKLWVNQKKSRHYGLDLDGDVRKSIDFTYRD